MDSEIKKQKEYLMEYISESYKDLYGVKIGCGPNMTLEELTEEADRLSDMVKEEIERERVEEDAIVYSLCNQFDCTREDLERWDVI